MQKYIRDFFGFLKDFMRFTDFVDFKDSSKISSIVYEISGCVKTSFKPTLTKHIL